MEELSEERRKKLPFTVWQTRWPDRVETVHATDALDAREQGAAMFRVARWDVSVHYKDPRSVTLYPWGDPPWWAPNPPRRRNSDNTMHARLVEVETLYADVVRQAEEIRSKHPDPDVMWEERVDLQREKDRLWNERWELRRKLGLDPRTGLKPVRAPRGRDVGASGHYPDILNETQDLAACRGSRIVRHSAPSSVLHTSCDDESFHHLRYALTSGEVVAGLTLRAGRPWRGEQSAVIDIVFTDAAHRRHGYASKLIEYARSIFRRVQHSTDLTDAGRAWKRAVRNGDERLRDLERRADQGDMDAAMQAHVERVRAGLPPVPDFVHVWDTNTRSIHETYYLPNALSVSVVRAYTPVPMGPVKIRVACPGNDANHATHPYHRLDIDGVSYGRVAEVLAQVMSLPSPTCGCRWITKPKRGRWVLSEELAKKQRRNPPSGDTRLRDLERRVATGDTDARYMLHAERLRHGLALEPDERHGEAFGDPSVEHWETYYFTPKVGVAVFWRMSGDARALARMEREDRAALDAGACCVDAPSLHEETCDGTGRELAGRVREAVARRARGPRYRDVNMIALESDEHGRWRETPFQWVVESADEGAVQASLASAYQNLTSKQPYMGNPRRNMDESQRALERAADAGDRTAFLAFLRDLERAGRSDLLSDLMPAIEFFYDNDLSDPLLPGTGRSMHALALAEAERTRIERGWQVSLSKDDYFNSQRERTESMKGMRRDEIAVEVRLIDPTPTGPGDGGSILDSVSPIFIDRDGPFDEEPDDLDEYPPDVRVAGAYLALKALRNESR